MSIAQMKRSARAVAQLHDEPPNDAFVEQVMRKLHAPARRARRRRLFVLTSAVALGAVIALALLPSTDDPVARGSLGRDAQKIGVEVFIERGNTAPVPIEGRVTDGTAFSFVVNNRSGEARHMMLFAVDAAGDVHWFYPAHTDAARDPSSVPLLPGRHVLPDAVSPDTPAAGPMTIYLLAPQTPTRVSEVEAALKAGSVNAVQRIELVWQR